MKKRIYLYRLMLMVVLICIPMLVFCVVLWQRASMELMNSSQKYYENTLINFGNSLNAKIEDLKIHAADIIVSSKQNDSVFNKAKKLFSDNAYWYSVAVDEMSNQFFCRSASEWGIYLYEKDRVITARGTMAAEDYIKRQLNVPEESALIRGWFSEENFRNQKEVLGTTNVGEEIGGKLFWGYMGELGVTHDKVLIFYLLDANDFNGIYEEIGFNLYVMGTDGSEIYLALITDDGFMSEFSQDKVGMEEIYNSNYKINDESLPLTYVIQLTDDALQSHIITFYYDIKRILILLLILLLCVCGVMLFFTYKPVYLLTETLDYKGGSEFRAFHNVLQSNHVHLFEQKILIMDLLINNLVSGQPVSKEKLEILSKCKSRFYCVMFLGQCKLSAQEAEKLSIEMENKYKCQVFITDWEDGEKEKILILFMEENNCEVIVEAIGRWFWTNLSVKIDLRIGQVVDGLEKIKLSYDSCCKSDKGREKKEKVNKKIANTAKREREIMEYIDIHFSDEELCLTMIADEFQMSVYTLSRMLKKTVGIGFVEYVNCKRIEYSKELLLTTEMTVKDISLKVGFQNTNYFCKMFKYFVGVSPASFRNEIIKS